jgi:adenylyltransferase/sulfurtransferase
MSSCFTEGQAQRYARQLILPGIGSKGQQRLLDSSVLIVGVGGLGSPCALYLAAAGVGRIGLLDRDSVELSNLHRQILHNTGDLGRSKTQSGRETLERLNPDVTVISLHQRIEPDNAFATIAGYEIIVDGSDNFPTKFLLNDACVLSRKPLVHAGVSQFEGQVTTILPTRGPCYRCVFPDPPPPCLIPTCQEAGILGVLPGVIGAIQATEVIKYLLGLGDLLVGRMLVYNALQMSFREVPLPRDPDCPLCGEKPTIRGL